jgi:hypothetical protein
MATLLCVATDDAAFTEAMVPMRRTEHAETAGAVADHSDRMCRMESVDKKIVHANEKQQQIRISLDSRGVIVYIRGGCSRDDCNRHKSASG